MSGRVIVVGSVNVDLVAHAGRLPAPGETVTGATFSEHDGGKGANQAVAAARLGAAAAFVGAVGRDAFAMRARAALVHEGIDLSGLRVAEGSTGVALILVDDPKQRTVAGALGAFQGQWGTDIPLLSAGSILILLPSLIVFVIFQRQVITALLQGSVKG